MGFDFLRGGVLVALGEDGGGGGGWGGCGGGGGGGDIFGKGFRDGHFVGFGFLVEDGGDPDGGGAV